MPEISMRKIYRQNEKLEEQVPLWAQMNSKKQTTFLKEVQALIVAARQTASNAQTEEVKNRLISIIETWEKILSIIDNIYNEDYDIISRFDKASATSTRNRAKEDSIINFVRNIPSYTSQLISQSMSNNKFGSNSPVSIPHNPELRAIYDELYGTIDSTGDAK
jgi:hypothetical protein